MIKTPQINTEKLMPHKHFIKLSEIPEEGTEFIFSKATGEVKADLQDLIGPENFEAKFFIKPLNAKDFDVRGTLKTASLEDCSLCGDRFALKADLAFHEILIPQTPRSFEKKSGAVQKQARSNHFSELDEEGPGVIEYSNDEFDIGACLRQVLVLSVPFNPKPPAMENGDCKVCLKSQNQSAINYDEKMGEAEQKNPFQVLKGIKLN